MTSIKTLVGSGTAAELAKGGTMVPYCDCRDCCHQQTQCRKFNSVDSWHDQVSFSGLNPQYNGTLSRNIPANGLSERGYGILIGLGIFLGYLEVPLSLQTDAVFGQIKFARQVALA